jgi:hypothetical protein
MEMSQKEAKDRLDELKRKALVGKGEMTERDLDGLEVKGKDGKHYRWLNNKAANVDRKSLEGWEICHDKDVKGGLLQGDVHKNGDLVLAEISEEEFQKKATKNRERRERLQKSSNEGFHDQGRRLKVETFEE